MNPTQSSGLMLDREPEMALRDPAAIYANGVYHCFHTAVVEHPDRYELFVDVSQSSDLRHWNTPRRLTAAEGHFSSPGNVVRYEDRWILCLQSYPVPPGQEYASEEARLWLMESADLEEWSAPRLIQPKGCQAKWTTSKRQIDPYLVEHDGKFWCFYKTAGQLGVLVSEDLLDWQEAQPDKPVFTAKDTPDGSTVENPCIVKADEEFLLFLSPCRKGRGIGVARSQDLLHWTEAKYLHFPALSWAVGGPTAAMVLDTRAQNGRWTMFFHGDRIGPHSAALGLALSDDLENWELI